ncbi:DNA topoisomerase IV subunit A [Ureaplasma ceti]|uniref:DNA topoisomerase (ATP-hydrolyzing) n=1 Tax=Ureaplasma ceti TaxID=3119530 RepID=A0ABP9UCR5_9BACT
MDKDKKLINQPLSILIGDCFGRYAKYIIQDRALPDARDGLKPVQRRILYAMYELGLTADKSYKKSARTVGEVIGKYHPHGDFSIYEAMVRMSQDWKNNLPLLDMHGNNGSIDGDSAAAMRYTECKLSEVSNLMLSNIKKNTVPFAFNFDDSEKEPTVLPAMLPNLLINGGMGIAAGYATNIPTHNPTEIFNGIIYLIDNPNAHLDTLLKIIPGPDFPTGGIIEGAAGIRESFETGRGKFIISSKIKFDEKDKKVNRLIVTEIPYDTSKATIIKELNEILYDEKVGGILEVRDESDKNGISIVIDVKKDKNLNQVRNYLLKNTHLQINYSTNFVTIVNRKPVLLSMKEALQTYIDHALDIQRKTALFDLKKAQDRLEIVEGLIKAINAIDIVIKLIRQADSKESARQALIDYFNITWNQAEAIVVLRLYRLTKTDINDLLQESAELIEKINNLQALLSSEALQKQLLKQIMRDYREKYGYDRKTQIREDVRKLEVDETEMIEVKELAVLVSRDGYIKVVTKKTFDSNSLQDGGIKQSDFVFYVNSCLSNQYLLLVTQEAKTLVLPLYKMNTVKWKDVGEHINSFTTIGPKDKIMYAQIVNEVQADDALVLITRNGMAKVVKADDAFNTKQLKSSTAFKLKGDDGLISVSPVKLSQDYFVSILNNHGVGYTFSSGEIPITSKTASGVKTMKLKPDEHVVNAVVSKTLKPYVLLVSYKNGVKLVNLADFKVSARTAVGKIVSEQPKNIELNNMVLVNRSSSVVTILTDENDLLSINTSSLEPNAVRFTKIKTVNAIVDSHINDYLSDAIKDQPSSGDVLPKARANETSEDTDDDVEQLTII